MCDLDIFAGLDLEEKETIKQLARKKFYRKGEYLFREGDPADTIYLVKLGKIKLTKVSDAGKEVILDILTAENVLGESTFLDGGCYSMSAQAIEDAFVCLCTKNDFTKLLQNPQIALKLIQGLMKKIELLSMKIADLAFLNVKSRVASVLARLARECGHFSPIGLMIDLRLSHHDLASLVGASRVMVSQVLKQLENEGLIRTDCCHFTVLDMEGLKNLAGITD